jgi:hypothetical protein
VLRPKIAPIKNKNVIPNPRQRGGVFISRRTGVPGARFVRWGGSRGEGSCASSVYLLAIKKQFICIPVGRPSLSNQDCGIERACFFGTSSALDFFLFIVTIHITTTNNLKINVIPNPRQRTRAVFSA